MKRTADRTDGIDALLWLLAAVTILFLIPIGFVSNDGLGHSRDFAAGSWHLDPNHLLFEPLGAWWQNAWMRHGYGGGDPVDALKLLSALAGALAAGLFRWGVAPRLARTRWEANHATAWLAFSSAFLRLWVSDETHMIQMPFVVAMAWLALVDLARPSFARGLALGAAAGLAALTFISNLLIGAAVTLLLIGWQLRRRELRRAGSTAVAVGLGTALAAGVPLLFAWLGTASARSSSFFGWLTRYGGGRVGERVEGAYGLVRSWRGVEESVVRAAYGAASALVDLTPVAAAVRDHEAPSLRVVLGALAFLAAGTAMLAGLWTALRRREEADRGALLIGAAWLAAILGFGIFWNNSDDQFYFQLAPAFAALAARMTARRGRALAVVLAMSLAGLLWNLIDVASDRVFYPRAERMALLEREVRGACLAVTPGFDEPELLLAMSPVKVGRTSITNLAVGFPPAEGLGLLHRRIERCLDAGGRVVLIDLYDTPPERNPWKYLRRLGYDHATVERSLADLPVEGASRQVGPFTVRSCYSRGEPRRNR